MLCEAIHGAIHTVHVLENHSWNKLRREGDDESLRRQTKSVNDMKYHHYMPDTVLGLDHDF